MNKELTLLEPHELKHYHELKAFVAIKGNGHFPEMLKSAKMDIDYYQELAAERAADIVELCNTGSNIELRLEEKYGIQFMYSGL